MKEEGQKPITRILLIIFGSLFLTLGFIGIFLPLLPTTPFLLLAAACYIRSSPKLYHWLITHKYFGSYIKNYRQGRGIPLKAKVITITLLWLTIGFSAYTIKNVHVCLLLFIIATGVTIHLLRFKTLQAHD